MTDADIKKALECCSAESLAQKKCKQCPYHKRSSVQCIGRLCKDAFELIRRQQAEIKRLKSIEPTEEVRVKCEEVINKIRADAVREFAEMLKEVFVTIDGTFECSEVEEHIDALVKETFPEQKGKENG